MTTLVTGAFGCIGAWVIRGPAPATSLAVGVRQMLEKCSRLQRRGRLDFRELT